MIRFDFEIDDEHIIVNEALPRLQHSIRSQITNFFEVIKGGTYIL